ncbi:hypothetical protein HanRHA438_Chr00c42g0857171 [Helianthus annuus]|nr:hypothetical protein HanRHA438_Chr00c42g0857171 [Helianthus annuus]
MDTLAHGLHNATRLTEASSSSSSATAEWNPTISQKEHCSLESQEFHMY